jgi:hypothetical protein
MFNSSISWIGCKFVAGARVGRIADVDRIVATTLPQLLSLFVHNKVPVLVDSLNTIRYKQIWARRALSVTKLSL